MVASPAVVVEDAEAAVDGRCVLYDTTWVSDRAVRVRPSVVSYHGQVGGPLGVVLTSAVRRMLFDLSAQLWYVLPATGTSCFVQLRYVAQSFLALGVFLRFVS